jgi:predicted DNA-binding transcriptional regulator
MIHQLLSELGFGEKEIAIYLCILKNGTITPSNVARLTRINRTTVYAVAKELVRRGIIAEDLASKTGHLLALPPSELFQLAIREEQQLVRKRETIQKAVEELQELTKEVRYSIPKITFVAEEDLEGYLRKQTPTWNKSIIGTDGLWWGFQDSGFAENYSDWIDWYWDQPSSRDFGVRILTDRSQVEDQLADKGYSRRQVKYWSESGAFSAATWVMGSYITMIHTKTRPHYLIDIRDAAMASNQRALFKGLWEMIPAE